MFKSIRTSLGLVLGLLILIGVISTGTTLWVVRSQSVDALVINLAGRQRMLSQRVAKLALLGAQYGQAPDYLKEMHATAHEWEQTFQALQDGGQVVYEGRMVSLPPTTEPAIRAQLERVWSLWQPFHSAAHAILENPPESPAFAKGLAAVDSLSESILTEMDQAVQMYQAAAAARVAWVEQVQVIFLLTGAAVIAFGFAVVSWQIIRPLDLLGVAIRQVTAGDLVSPVPAMVKNEIGALAAAFDEMRRRLAQRNAEAQERLERITALHDIDVAITSQLNLETRLNALLEKVTERLRVDAAAVALIEPETRALTYAARRGLDGEFFQDGLLKEGEGIAGQVAHTGQVVTITDVRTESRFVRRPIAEKLGIVSYLAVPLRVRGEIIGVFELATRERHTFPAEEVNFFVTLAGQAAVAIENARLFEETRRRAEQLKTLYQVGQVLNSTLDSEAILEQVIDEAVRVTGASHGCMLVVDNVDNRFVHRALRGFSPELIEKTLATPLRLDQGVNGRAYRTQQVILIDDVRQAPDYVEFIPQTRAELVIPMIRAGKVLGNIDIQSAQVGAFREVDLGLLKALADQAAIAIENARLFESERAQLLRARTLQELGALLTSQLTMDQVAEIIFNLLSRVVQYDSVSIQLIEKDGSSNLWAGRGFLDIEGARQILREVSRHALKRDWTERKALVIPDTHNDSRWLIPPGSEYICSWIGAPLMIKGNLIGVLNVDSKTVNAYNAEIGETVMAFADQAAIAIENARLFEETRRRGDEFAALYETTRDLAAQYDLSTLLQTIVARATMLLAAPTGHIYLYDAARNDLELAVTKNLPMIPLGTRLQLGEGLAGRVAQTRQPLIVDDYQTWPQRSSKYEGTPFTGVIQVPMLVGGELIGVLGASELGATTRKFTEADTHLLSLFAAQAASTMHNARLYAALDEEKRRLELLYNLSHRLTESLNPYQVAATALDYTCSALGAFNGTVFIAQPGTDRLQLLAASGMDQAEIETLHESVDLQLGQGLTGWTAVQRKTMIVPDVTQDEHWVTLTGLDDWVRSAISVPLLAGDPSTPSAGQALVGVLNLLSDQLAAFREEHIAILQAAAASVAVALQNARLFAETQRLFEAEQTRRTELAALYDLSRALADTTDFDAILSIITRRAVETLQVTFARVALLDGEEFVLRAACPARGLDRDLGVGRREHAAAHPYCQRVLEQNVPVVLRADHPDLSEREREMLFLDPSTGSGQALAQTLCLAPLRVGERALGLLMLGEGRREEREPFTAEKIRLAHSIGDQAASALRRAELFDDLERSYLQTVLALANSVDAKDSYTSDHARRLAEMALAVGREMGMTPHALEDLRYGAILHDIGKIGVPDAVLQKPAKLDADEWTQMRRHPEIGSRILAPVPRLAGAARIVRHHHERFDGKGYPDGLVSEAIPLGARILTVVDSYSAIVDKRIYKAARSHEEAVAELQKQAGTQFDPRIVKVFLQVLKRGLDITGGGGG